jgi:hypothetical protein
MPTIDDKAETDIALALRLVSVMPEYPRWSNAKLPEGVNDFVLSADDQELMSLMAAAMLRLSAREKPFIPRIQRAKSA